MTLPGVVMIIIMCVHLKNTGPVDESCPGCNLEPRLSSHHQPNGTVKRATRATDLDDHSGKAQQATLFSGPHSQHLRSNGSVDRFLPLDAWPAAHHEQSILLKAST